MLRVKSVTRANRVTLLNILPFTHVALVTIFISGVFVLVTLSTLIPVYDAVLCFIVAIYDSSLVFQIIQCFTR